MLEVPIENKLVTNPVKNNVNDFFSTKFRSALPVQSYDETKINSDH